MAAIQILLWTLTELVTDSKGAIVLLPEWARTKYAEASKQGRKSADTLKFLSAYEKIAQVETTVNMFRMVGEISLEQVNGMLELAREAHESEKFDAVLVSNTPENRKKLAAALRAIVKASELVKENRKDDKDNGVTIVGRSYSDVLDGYHVTFSVVRSEDKKKVQVDAS